MAIKKKEPMAIKKKEPMAIKKKENVVINYKKELKIKRKSFFLLKNTGIKLYSYERAKVISKKEDKTIYLIIYSENCKYCIQYFSILNNKGWFTRYLKNNFIVAYLNAKETIQYPQFQTSMYPTTFLVNKNEVIVTNPIKGIPELNNYFRSFLYGIGTYNFNNSK